jgi:hypothetical protein
MRAKAPGKNRNNAGINMETIQENSSDDDSGSEMSDSKGSSSVSQNTSRMIEADPVEKIGFEGDITLKSELPKEEYMLPVDDEEEKKNNQVLNYEEQLEMILKKEPEPSPVLNAFE